MSNSDRVNSSYKPASTTSHIEGSWLQTNTPSREALEAASESMQNYRSAEQLFTDRRQSTGFESLGPVAIGYYEVGRSSMPHHCRPTRHFYNHAGAAKREVLHPHPDGYNRLIVGDPGAYDPYKNRDLAFRAAHTMSRDRKPFNASAVRTMQIDLYGEDVPGPGSYDVAKARDSDTRGGVAKAINPILSAFRSGSTQRPSIDQQHSPAVGTYSPDLSAIEAHRPDSGASMRSTASRWDPLLEKSVGRSVGPGAYEHGWKSISHRLSEAKARQSALKPGFGTCAPQRALPFDYSRHKMVSPDPGSYQPIVWTGAPRMGGKGRPKAASPKASIKSASPKSKKGGGTPRPAEVVHV